MQPRRDPFQAIADPTRREIIQLVARQPQNVTSLAEKFKMSRQAISLHVKILEECKVLDIRKVGRQRKCHVRPESLEEIEEWLQPLKQIWEQRFNQLDDLLKTKQANNDSN